MIKLDTWYSDSSLSHATDTLLERVVIDDPFSPGDKITVFYQINKQFDRLVRGMTGDILDD